MSEEKNNIEETDQYADALVSVKTAKVAVADAKSELRKWKKANKIRKPADAKTDELKTEFATQEAGVKEVELAYEEAKAAADALKPAPQRGGGGSYVYSQITDLATGEKRDPDEKEKKKWRTHARKVAKKDGILAKDVPFEPAFFEPKVAKKTEEVEKTEKVKKAPSDPAPEAKEAPVAAKAERRSRRKK